MTTMSTPWSPDVVAILREAMVQNPPKKTRGQIAARYDIAKVMEYIKEKNGGVAPAYEQVRSKIQHIRVKNRGASPPDGVPRRVDSIYPATLLVPSMTNVPSLSDGMVVRVYQHSRPPPAAAWDHGVFYPTHSVTSTTRYGRQNQLSPAAFFGEGPVSAPVPDWFILGSAELRHGESGATAGPHDAPGIPRQGPYDPVTAESNTDYLTQATAPSARFDSVSSDSGAFSERSSDASGYNTKHDTSHETGPSVLARWRNCPM
ncbi:hypothetical protein B0H14DRAFT_3142890 [Mycena olivaceomarginata]|nr:hypothetical protein B0H14DRAFT_3142890 [Mycena olivaceomarginata]